MDPGERVTFDVVVKNSTPFATRFTSTVLDVERFPEGGQPLNYVPAGTTPRSAATWLTAMPSTFRLGPSQEEQVRLAFDVPSDARPGGRYVGLVFTVPDPTGSQVQADVEIPVTTLLTVSGEFERGLRARLVPRDGWRWRGGRTTWDLRLHNYGDVHENVSGRIRIDGFLAGPRSVAVDPGILLPGERRLQRVDLDVRAAPDVYTGRATVQLDDARPATAPTSRVIVVPWWLIVLLLGGLAIVAWRVRARRSRGARAGEDGTTAGPL